MMNIQSVYISMSFILYCTDCVVLDWPVSADSSTDPPQPQYAPEIEASLGEVL